jgi:hypothetical protein
MQTITTIGFDIAKSSFRQPRRRGYEWAAECAREHGRRKDRRQSFGQARQ